MEEYIKIRDAIAERRPDLIADFDAQEFACRLPTEMRDWLDVNLPIRDGWGWRLIHETADLIRHLEEHQDGNS